MARKIFYRKLREAVNRERRVFVSYLMKYPNDVYIPGNTMQFTVNRDYLTDEDVKMISDTLNQELERSVTILNMQIVESTKPK